MRKSSGANLKSIARQAMMAGEELPEGFGNEPELHNGLQLYLQAFFDLDLERSHSTGITPIPFSAIANYAAYFAFDEEQTENLFYFIKNLDEMVVSDLANRKKREDAISKNRRSA